MHGEMESRFATKYNLAVINCLYLCFEGNFAECSAKFFVLHFYSFILLIANKFNSTSFSLTSADSLFCGTFHLTNAIRLNEQRILLTNTHFNTSCPNRPHQKNIYFPL